MRRAATGLLRGAWPARGARVAFDFSRVFLERARARSAGFGEQIEYHHADATDEAQILALGRGRLFDAAVCTMALMDMAAVEPLFARSAACSGRAAGWSFR